MTPAYVLSLVYPYAGYCHAESMERLPALALILGRVRRHLPAGWEACSCRGTEPPPRGAILIGALAAKPGGSDDNLYVYPISVDAMLLRDRAETEGIEGVACALTTEEPVPNPN